MPMYNVGKTIKEFRKRRNLSQEELCEGLCEPPTLSKIECGRQNPTKKLEKQFYLFASAVLISKLKNETEKALDMLIASIKLTFPNYENNIDFSTHLLTVFELIILNNIALLYLKMSKKDDGINLLLKLEEYFCKHEIEKEEFAKQYPIIVDNLIL